MSSTAASRIPGPPGPALRHLVEMSMDPYGFFDRARARYGELWTLLLPGQDPIVVCAEPNAVRQMLTGGYDDYFRFADGIRFILGDHAVIFQQDSLHKETRKLMVSPFHGERMRAYGAEMSKLSDDTIAGWGERVQIHTAMQDITLAVILRCVFGITDEARLRSLGRDIVSHLDRLMTPWAFGASLVFSGARVRDFLRKHSRRNRRIDAVLFDEIGKARALPPEALAKRTDILAMLVAARYDDGEAMSDEVLRDHLMTLLIGGHETTATSLAWAIYCALQHPGTIEKMRDEVSRVMGDRFDAARVKELAYVGAVANESMRLYPIATGVNRRLKRELTLAGRTLPAGTLVAPSIYLTQRDPRVWPEPTAFRPERFLEGKASVYQFFPFGAGVWRCLGAQFADYEMRVVLARVVAQLDLELEPGVTIKPMQRGFTVAPSQMPVRLRRIAAASARAA